MKFNIINEGKEVQIKLTFHCGYAGQYIYSFTNNCNQKSYAGLVAETVYDQFSDHIKQIREAAYNEGWNDKKKRLTKRANFDWCPNVIEMERW